MNKSIFSIGDLIIDSDQIHTITKIENDVLFYKPVSDNLGGCTSSIPIKNLSLACIRPLLTKSEIKVFLENLNHEEATKVPFNTKNQFNNGNFLKEILYLNNPHRTGQLLVYLFKTENDLPLSKSDQSIFDQAISHLADEISFVNKISVDNAKNQILTALKKITPISEK